MKTDSGYARLAYHYKPVRSKRFSAVFGWFLLCLWDRQLSRRY